MVRGGYLQSQCPQFCDECDAVIIGIRARSSVSTGIRARSNARARCTVSDRIRARYRATARANCRVRSRARRYASTIFSTSGRIMIRISAGSRWMEGYTSKVRGSTEPQLSIRSRLLWLSRLKRAVNKLTRELSTA